MSSSPPPGGNPQDSLGKAATDRPLGSRSTVPSNEEAWRDDLSLTRRTLDGDPVAIREFSQHMLQIPPFLQRLATASPRSLHGLDVADVAQEAARRVWANRSKFDGRSRLKTWCCGIAYRTFLEELRRASRQSHREEEYPPESLSGMQATDNVLRSVSVRFEMERLEEVISTLSVPEQAVVRDHLFYEMDFIESGRVLGISTAAAKARFYRAFTKVKAQMTGQADGRPLPGTLSE